jgi:hypothetical protein
MIDLTRPIPTQARARMAHVEDLISCWNEQTESSATVWQHMQAVARSNDTADCGLPDTGTCTCGVTRANNWIAAQVRSARHVP